MVAFVFNLSKGNFLFKLFFDPDDELGLYCELFLEINLPAGEMAFHEKDEEYRDNIITAMTRD